MQVRTRGLGDVQSCAQGHTAGKGWGQVWVATALLLPSRESSWTLSIHGLANLGLLPRILPLSGAQAGS